MATLQDLEIKPGYVRALGVFLLLAALLTAISIPARLVAGADQPTLAESLRAIAMNKDAYVIGSWARHLSGLALEAAVLCLLRSRWGQFSFTLMGVIGLLAFSGLATTLSGFCSLVLARNAPEIESSAVLLSAGYVEELRPWDMARWILGKTGFSLAGLGLIALGVFLRRASPALQIYGVVGAIIGFGMLFIWIDAVTMVHRIAGAAFLLWLIGAGAWFWQWNPEIHEKYGPASTTDLFD